MPSFHQTVAIVNVLQRGRQRFLSSISSACGLAACLVLLSVELWLLQCVAFKPGLLVHVSNATLNTQEHHCCCLLHLQAAAPMVVGMLAFGGKWDSLLGLDASGIYPIKLADDHSSTAKKVRCARLGSRAMRQRCYTIYCAAMLDLLLCLVMLRSMCQRCCSSVCAATLDLSLLLLHSRALVMLVCSD
jgi:hypothetical protein